MTIPRTLTGQIADIYRRLAETERRARNRKRTGVVTEVDNAKGLARVEISKDGDRPFLSPWLPWKEIAAGGIKSHIPPTVGEQVDVVSESGDLTDAVIDMSTPSNQNARPHDGPEAVITKGESRIQIGDDAVTVTATNIRLAASAEAQVEAANIKLVGPVVIEGASVTHNGKNIGDSHIHGGVVIGGDTTTPPAN